MNYIAIRTFYRLWGPISDQLETAATADAGFDAGEWSASIHAKQQQALYYEYVAKVARAFQMRVEQLDRQIEAYNYLQWDKDLDAKVNKMVAQARGTDA